MRTVRCFKQILTILRFTFYYCSCVVPSAAMCKFTCDPQNPATGIITVVPTKVQVPFTCPTGQICNSLYATCES